MKEDRRMKLLFASTLNLSDITNSGVKKKVFGQIEGFRKNGCYVDYICFENYEWGLIEKDTIQQRVRTTEKTVRKKFCHLLEQLLNNGFSYDVVYIRLPGMSFHFLKLLRQIRKEKTIIVLEVYTYPIIKERFESAKKRIASADISGAKELFSVLYDSLLYGFLHLYVNCIVTYSQDDRIWGIDTIKICNGIDFSKENVKKNRKLNTREIHLVTVANISYWHGYDRLIKGLSLYYKHNYEPKYRVYFHIVGDGPEKSNLERLTHELGLGEYVLFYGVKSGTQLDEIYEMADIGVASMGMHRKSIEFTSELKIREYFAYGLPFIIGTRDVTLENEMMERFYRSFPADDTPIDINRVIEFYCGLLSQDNIHEEMRNIGINQYDWKFIMRKVVKEIERKASND